ncbi:MAG: hypothetical protein ACOC8Q_01650 [Desulfosalsimonas sp.]
MGMAYYKKDYISRAKDALEKALELDPDFENADKTRKTLEKIKKEQVG